MRPRAAENGTRKPEQVMGKFSRKVDRVIDCHVHLGDLASVDHMLEIREQVGFDRINLVCIVDPRRGSGHAQALVAKAKAPDGFYCFGGLDHAAAASGGKAQAPPLAEQVDRLLEAGCDGIKLIEGKPTSRGRLGFALDGDYYRDFFARAEQRDVPLLWHVGDPEEFWDPATTPKWALDHGWGYGKGDVPKQQLYEEVEAVLGRHPRLRVIFAHFYFLSADLPQARDFLAAHPNASIDLAPGVEFLFNLSREPEAAREFFMAHAGRIVFGTDISSGAAVEQATARADLVRRFLESDESFTVPPEADELLEPGGKTEIRGLDLPGEVLEKIYHGNFESFAGAAPRPIDRQKAVAECRRQADVAARISGAQPNETEAGRCAAALERLV